MISAPPPLRVNSDLLDLLPTYLARTPARQVTEIAGFPIIEAPSRVGAWRLYAVPALPPGVLAILADPLNPTGAVALLADGTVLGPRQTPLRTA